MKLFLFLILNFVIFWTTPSNAQLSEDELSQYVVPPMQLGTKDDALPVWRILNGGGALAGYIFESRDLAPIPGFSGTPMNMLVAIDLEGRFIDVRVLDQNEPVFVSGLGIEPFHSFLAQYKGESLASNIKVGSVQGKSEKIFSNNVQLDGVTKATASVRIANQSILAASLEVARQYLAEIAPKPVSYPRKDLFEKMTWEQLVDNGLVQHRRILNRDIEKVFAGSEFSGVDEIANEAPDDIYLDIWIADLGLPTNMQNLMGKRNQEDLKNQLSPFEEPILVLANGRHSLVSDQFVRNSVPDRMGAKQSGFPLNMRDADIEVELAAGLPHFQQAMVMRIDTRLGFDPSSPWTYDIEVKREIGYFRPETALREISIELSLPQRFFQNEEVKNDDGALWLKSWQDQKNNLIILGLFLLFLLILLIKQKPLLGRLTVVRPLILLFTLVFVGWYVQGQLSIVTVIAFFKALVNGQDLSFMLYDPVSLLVWSFVLITFVLWGRGTFCGWLCPYGALQELTALIGRFLRIPQIKISENTTNQLRKLKYIILLVLLGTGLIYPILSDKLVEVEPFKTAITLQFVRDLPYVIYSVFWLILGLFIYKGFCRFICPLGAFMVLGGKLRRWDWIARRSECGSPCQLCRVSCEYDAIEKVDGTINYDECFQCLDCVDIMADDKRCVPVLLKNKKATRK